MDKEEIKRFFEGQRRVPKKFVKELERAKKASGEVDFGCGGTNCSEGWDTEKRCCEVCARCRGCFSWDDEMTASPEYYSEKYDSENGFWRPNIGCTLPREKRSLVCIKYRCDKVREKSKKEFLKFSNRLDEVLTRIRRE